jgi:hypothetical protein
MWHLKTGSLFGKAVSGYIKTDGKDAGDQSPASLF